MMTSHSIVHKENWILTRLLYMLSTHSGMDMHLYLWQRVVTFSVSGLLCIFILSVASLPHRMDVMSSEQEVGADRGS